MFVGFEGYFYNYLSDFIGRDINSCLAGVGTENIFCTFFINQGTQQFLMMLIIIMIIMMIMMTKLMMVMMMIRQ